MADLVALQYKRNDAAFVRGSFRRRGDVIEIFPAHYEDRAWRVSLFGEEVESITEFDPLTGKKTADLPSVKIYANSHYVTPRPTLKQAIDHIKVEMDERLKWFVETGKLLEAQRLEQRTRFDLEMMETTGSCAGIENYSRYLTGRLPGEPPPTLFEYVPENALLFADESHVRRCRRSGPCTRATAAARSTLAEYGFRLPSCMDNRPAQVRGVGGHAAADGARLRHPRPVGAGQGRRRVRRAGDPPHRPDRPAGGGAPGLPHPRRPPLQPGGRRDRRGEGHRAGRLSHPGHRAHQEDGRGPHRIHARAGGAGALHALGRGYGGADRDHPRPAAGRLRRAGGHQPAARGAGHPRVRPGGHPRRRQGGVPALGNLIWCKPSGGRRGTSTAR